jgi:pimeloyl-ACP methyl ester carboxylesterase
VLPGALVVGLFLFTRYKTAKIEQQFPPVGAFLDVGGLKLHYVDVRPDFKTDAPPVVFVHGASGNLRDQMLAFRVAFAGRRRLIFIDRPGHGYSERGSNDSRDPSQQAAAINGLLRRLEIPHAVLVGHSYGGAIVAAFGVNHPERSKGLVFLAPATHPWPGGISWYYTLAAMPLVGHLFTELLVMPAGLWRLKCAIDGVFSPDTPPQSYFEESGAELVLRPDTFRNNARDVAWLHKSVSHLSPRYGEIKSPTIIITGDSDSIVLAHIHSKGLERDIAGAKLIEFKDMGHKPDYAATSAVLEAIDAVSGTGA